MQELRELAGSMSGYVVLLLTERGVWRVLLDERGAVIRLSTSTGAQRMADRTRAMADRDVVLVAGFSLAEGRLLATQGA